MKNLSRMIAVLFVNGCGKAGLAHLSVRTIAPDDWRENDLRLWGLTMNN
jgi:hypothetical protein